MFLLDANVFIYAQRDYYPPDRVPEFWDWLAYQAEIGNIKVPLDIWDEIKPHDQVLQEWMKLHKENLILEPDDSSMRVAEVLEQYAPDLNEEELERIGKDPYLIAAALYYDGSIIVSKEGSSPSKIRANRKIPDICNDLGISCITDHKLIIELDFSTNWKSRI